MQISRYIKKVEIKDLHNQLIWLPIKKATLLNKKNPNQYHTAHIFQFQTQINKL